MTGSKTVLYQEFYSQTLKGPLKLIPIAQTTARSFASRTILIAYREAMSPHEVKTERRRSASELEQDLILLAVIGITDPLRPEAVTAIQQCNRAGITVRMLTGHSLHFLLRVDSRAVVKRTIPEALSALKGVPIMAILNSTK